MDQTNDPTKVGQITVIFIWLWLASDLVDYGSSMFTIFSLGGLGHPVADIGTLELADTLTMWTAGLNLLLFVAAAIVTARWIFVTNRNAQSFSDQVDMTPGWAVGWFFIPVASLFKPFQGVSATWRATVEPEDIDSVDVPILLRWWWALWLATCIWGNVIFRISLKADTPEELITCDWLDIATLLVDVPLACVFTVVITRLSAMQSQRLASSPVPIRTDDDSI